MRASGLDYTVVRPGGLTNDPGTGRVNLARARAARRGPRDDVAEVIAAVLHAPNTVGLTLDLSAATSRSRRPSRRPAGRRRLAAQVVAADLPAHARRVDAAGVDGDDAVAAAVLLLIRLL